MFLNIVCACDEDSKWRNDEDKHSRKVIASCVRAGAATSLRRGEKERGAEVLNMYYLCIFSISIIFPPACLPVPTYLQYVRKLFQRKRHIFPLSLLPRLLQEWMKTKLMSLAPPQNQTLIHIHTIQQ